VWGVGNSETAATLLNKTVKQDKYYCNEKIIGSTSFISANNGLDTRLKPCLLPEIAGHRSLDLRFLRFTRARAAS